MPARIAPRRFRTRPHPRGRPPKPSPLAPDRFPEADSLFPWRWPCFLPRLKVPAGKMLGARRTHRGSIGPTRWCAPVLAAFASPNLARQACAIQSSSRRGGPGRAPPKGYTSSSQDLPLQPARTLPELCGSPRRRTKRRPSFQWPSPALLAKAVPTQTTMNKAILLVISSRLFQSRHSFCPPGIAVPPGPATMTRHQWITQQPKLHTRRSGTVPPTLGRY